MIDFTIAVQALSITAMVVLLIGAGMAGLMFLRVMWISVKVLDSLLREVLD